MSCRRAHCRTRYTVAFRSAKAIVGFCSAKASFRRAKGDYRFAAQPLFVFSVESTGALEAKRKKDKDGSAEWESGDKSPHSIELRFFEKRICGRFLCSQKNKARQAENQLAGLCS